MILYKEVIKNHLANVQNVFSFADIETSFMPWLMSETETILNKKLTARLLLDG